MILVDMNQISLASMMMHLHMNKTKEPDGNMVRHMILNSLRMYRTRFSSEYGELVLCYDSKHYWRRDFFPEYKSGRRKSREKSEHDWDAIFNMLATIKNEIKTFMPYKVMEVESCEADDIIATLIKKVKNMIIPEHKKKILILSGDKDFIQLHGPNVRQYNPVLNKFVGKGEDPVIYIREHILKGDRSDGIPNVLSDDNVFIEGRRQRPLSKKKIEGWLNEVLPTFTEEQEKNYLRNRQLIDLSFVPEWLEQNINREFNDVKVATRDKILGYFINKKLKTLIESIDEF